MTITEKYQNVLDFGQQLGVRNTKVEETDGVLHFWGLVNDNYEKDQIWDSIKAIGGDAPSDIVADIQVENPGYYTKYTVEKGDSLSKIAKAFYGDLHEYTKIFNANRDTLENPDNIEVGQVLTIPNP
jgi:nucleoid-associated protein YgaU